jgi:O-antigen/teichoic acid export membrane protein
MSSKVINIARNTSYYTLALVVQKIISFTYFVIIARALGPDDLGKYYFAISFTTIFSILIDLGFSNVLTREVAKRQEVAQKYFSNILGLKIPLSILTFVIVAALSWILGYPALTRALILISSISMILDSFTLSFFAIMRGHHNLRYESISSIIFQLIVLLSGLLSLWLGWGLIWLVAVLSLASAYNFFYSLYVVKTKTQISLKPKLEKDFIKALGIMTLPFALFAIFQRIYTYVDSILLSSMSGDYAVGIYQVAFKIINALQFLPMAFAASLYPAFSSYWHGNREQLAITFERAMNYLLIISLPISIGIFTIADKIVLLFKDGYGDAVLPLQVTIASLVFVFLNFSVGALLNACDRQVINTKIIAFATVACISLNWLLIPHYGALGATIADAATNTLIFAIGILYVPTIVKYNYGKVIKNSLKILASAGLMGVISYYAKEYMNIFLVVALSGVVYFALLYAMKVFRQEDVASIMASFKKKTNESEI